jgi:uncharacterized protein YndB with AHSA1/START domain
MTDRAGAKRIDSGSRVIRASPQTIYRAFLDPVAVTAWRPPKGMKAHVYAFDPREGGTYRMSFAYTDIGHDVRGKTSEHADVFEGRFMKLVPNELIVERVNFESDDPAFAGTMTITTTLTPVTGGTEVTIRCEDVPPGIRPSDHQKGITSTLENLAEFTERPRSSKT